jgi:hypothetical protein
VLDAGVITFDEPDDQPDDQPDNNTSPYTQEPLLMMAWQPIRLELLDVKYR